MMWCGGLYGILPGGQVCPLSPGGLRWSSRITGQHRATIKAHPTYPNHPRPYGILDASSVNAYVAAFEVTFVMLESSLPAIFECKRAVSTYIVRNDPAVGMDEVWTKKSYV